MLNEVIFCRIGDTGNCGNNLFKYKLGSFLYQLIQFTLWSMVILLTSFRTVISIILRYLQWWYRILNFRMSYAEAYSLFLLQYNCFRGDNQNPDSKPMNTIFLPQIRKKKFY